MKVQKKCAICSGTIYSGGALKNGVRVCEPCINAAGYHIKGLSKRIKVKDEAELIKAIEENEYKRMKTKVNPYTLKVTKVVGDLLAVDETNGLWYARNTIGTKRSKVYSFEDVLSYKLLDNQMAGTNSVAAFCNSLRVKVTVDDMLSPAIYMDIIKDKRVSRITEAFRKYMNVAQEIMSVFQVMTERIQPGYSQPKEPIFSPTDEIRKYKGLLDDGIITPEEFNEQKKRLLNM